MGYRLSKIVTRTGDNSTTGLGNGQRVGKDNARIAVIGDIDELNSHIGLLLTELIPDDIRKYLVTIQHDLFDLGSEICILDNRSVLSDVHLARLDNWINNYNTMLPKLREFILPGGSRGASIAHVCRTVCRRAERSTVALHRQEIKNKENQTAGINNIVLQYLNRLSDLLFIFARVLNQVEGRSDVLWGERENMRASS